MKQYIFVFLLTGGLSLSLSWLVWRLSLRFRLYPAIRERDVHTRPTPRLGGVAVFGAVMAAFAVSRNHEFFSALWARPETMYAIMVAATIVVLVGVADDLWDLDWAFKLAAQLIAALLITTWGGLQISALPVGGVTVLPGFLSQLFTVIFIVVVMNAVNFIDGLDGLLTGVCFIASVVFFLYSYFLLRDFTTSNFSISAFIAIALAGGCIGFIPWNWPPARLFMGDSGALLLGLLLAVSGIAITGAISPGAFTEDEASYALVLGTLLPVLLPLAVIVVPLLDFGMAVVRRLSKKQSPFAPDRKHLHHRMLDLGHSAMQSTFIFWSWSALVGLTLLLVYLGVANDWPGGIIPALIFAALGVAACTVVTVVPHPKPVSPQHPDAEAEVSTHSSASTN